MKKIFYTLIFISILTLRLNAQQLNHLCNGDSAILVLSNYSGNIQWEKSTDSLNWTSIAGAIDDSLKIESLTNAYFRAVTINNADTCYSYIKKIVSESLPIARAGYDIDVNDSIAHLEASHQGNSNGYWTLISGSGGVIQNPFDSASIFRGYYDTTYTLIWKVTNGCGSVNDTVKVKFNKLVIDNKLIVIDSVNNLISDSVQLSNGIYIIQFNDTIPSISDSSIIVGQTGNGFLRKVTGHSQTGNIVTMQTTQASLADIIKSGAIRFTIDNNNLDTVSSKSDMNNFTKIDYLLKGVSIKNPSKNTNDGFQYNFSNVNLYDNGTINLSIPSGYIKFNPNFVFNFNSSLQTGVNKFYFYTDHALLQNNINVQLTASQSVQLLNLEKKLAQYSKNVFFLVGNVLPVFVKFTTTLKAKFTADIGANVTATSGITNTNTLSLGVKYENNQWQNVFNASVNNNITPVTVNGNVNTQLRLELIPEVSAKIYGVAGPFVEPSFWLQYNAAVGSPNLDWNAALKAGINCTAGVETICLDDDNLPPFSFDIPINFSLEWKAPNKVQIIAGNNQAGQSGQSLANPLKVKVTDNLNNPVKNVKVYFNVVSGGGSVSSAIVTTDANGFAQTSWTLGNAGNQTLNASVKKADGSHVFYSPLVFNASVSGNLAQLTTAAVSSITSSSAICGGNITTNGGSAVTARGVCWSTNSNPTIANSHTTDGNGNGSYTSNISGLAANTTYYVCAYATNGNGTAYGNSVSFATANTPPPGTVTDYDGNVYNVISIGSQFWLMQNLKTTHYKNGTSIPNVTNNTTWAGLTTGAYCDYDNTPANSATYGRIYNWYAVNTGNLCPTGWHVPTDAEWTTLTNYLGGESIAGGKLKATTLWNSPNAGATNSSGFTAFPGGGRASNGPYSYVGYFGFWWSSTESNTASAWRRTMGYGGSSVDRLDLGNTYGFSVRCLRD